jgi:prepilin-type N-terminal cleavage/methylation domain-containing protein
VIAGLRNARGEDGFTLIEVLVAAVILVVALFALLTTFDYARSETAGTERSAQAVRVAERELDRLLALPYSSLVPSSNAASPATCTQRSSIAGSYATGTAVAAVAGGAVTPTSTWSVTRIGATSSVRGCVYDYVTWVDDPICSDARCPGQQDYKRLTVAVSVTNANGNAPAGGPTKPVVVSAVKANPRIGPGGTTGDGSPCQLLQGCG